LKLRLGQNHALRTIRAIANDALARLAGDFSALYWRMGRPSIPPEKLLRAMLLQAFYSIRSERQLMDRLEFDLLFRWFVGIGVDDAAWDHSTFSKNRERLLEGDIAAKLLGAVLAQPRVTRPLSTDHFPVDGTVIEACASMKSFKPKDGDEPPADAGGRNGETDFHGQKRSNDTHASTPDPAARLYRKSGMSGPANYKLVGRWRIVEADIWDRDYLNLGGPATITNHRPWMAEAKSPSARSKPASTSNIQPLIGGVHVGGVRRNGPSLWRRFRRIARRRLHQDRIRPSQRRRSRPQSQIGNFFNSLLMKLDPRFRAP
jgi:transposase